jgi:hypothetical protein
MANYVLDKGMLYQGTNALVAGRFVKWGTLPYTFNDASVAGAQVAGVIMENVDAAKSATGKVVADIRMEGIARVTAGAAIAVGAEVEATATGTVITASATAGRYVVGVALQAASASGDSIDVLVTCAGRKQ